MLAVYKYNGKDVLEYVNEKESHKFNSLEEFLVDERELVETLFLDMINYVDPIFSAPGEKRPLRKAITEYVTKYFTKAFKSNKGELSGRELRKHEKTLEKKSKEIGEYLFKETKDFITKKLNKLFKNKVIGGDMFKNLKEAKNFTAHLDALATEIEQINDLSPEMKNHLAFRLDRLSDMIEVTADASEKTAALEKEANGVGSGAWAYDSDESRYMGTFGGTGSLEGDADESRYMNEFKGDDHKEVIQRKEPTAIKEDGPKKKQPSDNYDEAAVAKRLRSTVKSIMAELKEEEEK